MWKPDDQTTKSCGADNGARALSGTGIQRQLLDTKTKTRTARSGVLQASGLIVKSLKACSRRTTAWEQ